MKKIKQVSSFLAFSAGIVLFGANTTHAETLYDSAKTQFTKEQGMVTKSSDLRNLQESKIANQVKASLLPQEGFRMESMTGNTLYESEPNNTFATANVLNQGDIVKGTFTANDIDVYAINVPRAEIVGIFGAMPTTSFSNIGYALYDSNEKIVNPFWNQLGNHQFSTMYNLTPGVYYIAAVNIGQYVTNDYYSLAWDSGANTNLNAPQVNKVTDVDNTVSGTAQPGSTVYASAGGNLIGTTVAESDGKFSMNIPIEKIGTVISVFQLDTKGNFSNPTNVTVVSSLLNGWVVQNGSHYYYLNNVKKTGWLLDNGKWYFLNNQTGALTTGWVVSGGKWYYLDSTGVMKTGWVLSSGRWYYLDNSGAMKTGWLLYGGNWYFLNNNGSMATGWVLTGGKWYYLYGSGVMAHDTKIGSYRLGHDGAWIR